ncbi:hypothetical protein Abr02nite_83820 [Paractinoplanes brasiliensis]|nr:hypothetical protein Abr02nite_83820 [Actinoplanes brasiliensis]
MDGARRVEDEQQPDQRRETEDRPLRRLRRSPQSGIPAAEIDRTVAFQRRWGGLVLPPAPQYDGGPRYFQADTPDSSPTEAADGSPVPGWWFEAGPQRTAVPYSFMIGPTDEFGIHDGRRWVPLHASIEGWIESLALAHHAANWAKQITKVTGHPHRACLLRAGQLGPARRREAGAKTY